jgi:ankyrin repeat protein
MLACCSSVRSAQQVVQLLLDAGASASAASSRGLTALHAAAQFSNCAVVALLLQAGALPSALTREGESALALAQRRGDAEGEAVSALLSTVSDSSLRADAPVRRSLIHHGEPGGELPLGELHH